MASGRDRRKKERLDAKLFIEILSLPMKETKGRGVVLDVSLTGFGIETEAEMEIGEEVECHLEVPLEVKAKVVRRITEGQVKRYGLILKSQSFVDKFIMKKVLKGKRSTKKI